MNETSGTITKTNGRPVSRIEMIANGEATIAQAAGLTRSQLYEIAGKAYQLFGQGRLEEARKIYEGLVAADPFDSVFHCHLGAVLWRAGDTRRAFEEFDAAVRYNYANVDALASRGELLIGRGEFEKGVEDLSRALHYDPAGSKPSTQRARALLLSLRAASGGESEAGAK